MPRAITAWQLFCGSLTALAILALAFTLFRRGTPETLITIAPVATPAQAGGQTVTVFVGGAVQRPGVYTLPRGERIEAAIAAAGGLAPDADGDGINRALLLRDEGQVVVPRRGEPTATPALTAAGAPATLGGPTPPAKGATPPPDKININTADAATLARLPGVGPKIAQEIVDYRAANGPFTGAAQLAGVRGISERMVADWADLITFGP